MKKTLASVVVFLAQPEFLPIERRILRALYMALIAYLGVKGVEAA